MKGKLITTAEAKAMRELRLAGMTYKAIATRFGVTLGTACRHTSEAAAKKMRARGRNYYERIKADPTRYAEYRAKKTAQHRAWVEKNKR